MKVLWFLVWSLTLVLLVRGENSTTGVGNEDTTIKNGVQNEEEYKLKEEKEIEGAMGALYRMSRGFIHALSPKEPILDVILHSFKDSKEITTDATEIIKKEAGFMAALVLGLLLFFGLGIGGTFFCCCRCCCGKCGASKPQKMHDNIDTRRQVYCALLLVTVIFMTAAVGCAYNSSKTITDSLVGAEGTTVDILDDVNVFFNSTTKKLVDMTMNKAEEIKDDVVENLKNIGEVFGVPIQTTAIKEIDELSKSTENITKKLQVLRESKETLQGILYAKKKVAEVKKEIKVIKPKCQLGTCSDIDGVETSNISGESLEDIPDIDLDEEMKEAKNEAMNISEKVKKETNGSVADVEYEMNKFLKTLREEVLQKPLNESSKVSDSVVDAKKSVGDAFEHVQKYEKPMYWALVGIVSLVSIPLFLVFLGMLCGCMGHRKSRQPSDRGCLSNCGATTIITGVYLLFFVTGIPILTTIIIFQLGGNFEAHICRVIYEEKRQSMDKLFDFMKTKMNLNGDMISDIQPSTTFNDCKKNATIFNALKLDKLFNLDEELDLKKKLNLEEKLNDFNFDTTGEIFPDNILEEMKKLDTFDKDGFNQLKVDLKEEFINEKKFTEWKEKLQKAAEANAGNKNVEEDLKKQLKILNEIDQQEIEENRTAVATNLNDIEAKDVQAMRADLERKMNDTLERVAEKTNQMKDEFVHDMVSKAEKQAEDLKTEIRNKTATCHQVWVIFDVTRHLVCRDILNPLNAYWFSMGWALIFSVFAIAFGTKLSRHYKRLPDNRFGKVENLPESPAMEALELSNKGMMRVSTSYMNRPYQPPSPQGPPPYVPERYHGHGQPYDIYMQGNEYHGRR